MSEYTCLDYVGPLVALCAVEFLGEQLDDGFGQMNLALLGLRQCCPNNREN